MESKTQLSKLDTIPRFIAGIIHRVPRDAHSEPLLRALRLEPLEERRTNHIDDLASSILAETTFSLSSSMVQYTMRLVPDSKWAANVSVLGKT